MGESLRRPGFRFHPTDVELVMYYLMNKLLGIMLDPQVIAEVNINDFSPWELPAKSILRGDLKWYFFSPKLKKYASGPRMKRATKSGYWKGTGIDKEVKYKGRHVGMRKTLIFYRGNMPKGTRTDWVMHEYRMEDEDLAYQGVVQEAYVICKVYKKSGRGPKNGAQYGGPFEKEHQDDDDEGSTVTSIMTFGVLVNHNNASCSSVTNITSTEPEPGPSTVTPSVSGATTEMLNPNNASTSSPSTITSWENEGHTDVPIINDGDMLTYDDLDLLLCDNDPQEVEDTKGKKVMIDDGICIFDELPAVTNLPNLSPDMIFSVEEFDDATATIVISDIWE